MTPKCVYVSWPVYNALVEKLGAAATFGTLDFDDNESLHTLLISDVYIVPNVFKLSYRLARKQRTSK
jgi:hypothetical protein